MTAATRIEQDAFGPVEIPSDRYWGAQTQRSIGNFPIGRDTFVERCNVSVGFVVTRPRRQRRYVASPS